MNKMINRIGMTVFIKDDMRKGTITSFVIEDKPDGSFQVYYSIIVELNDVYLMQRIHESNVVIMKGTEL